MSTPSKRISLPQDIADRLINSANGNKNGKTSIAGLAIGLLNFISPLVDNLTNEFGLSEDDALSAAIDMLNRRQIDILEGCLTDYLKLNRLVSLQTSVSTRIPVEINQKPQIQAIENSYIGAEDVQDEEVIEPKTPLVEEKKIINPPIATEEEAEEDFEDLDLSDL